VTLKLHNLPGDPGARRKRRRIGRGESSGWGKTAGRGHKGAQARSGGSKAGGFEGGQTPLTRRIPKFGFSNAPFRRHRAEVTLAHLNRFEDGAVVDPAALKAARLIARRAERVKVIATGTLERRLTVRLHGFSAAARAAIEARGGSWQVIEE